MTTKPNDKQQPRDLGISLLCLGIVAMVLWLVWKLFTINQSVGV